MITDHDRAQAQTRRACELCHGTAVNVDAAGNPNLGCDQARPCRPDYPIRGCPNFHAWRNHR
jgi:hypothetical protein